MTSFTIQRVYSFFIIFLVLYYTEILLYFVFHFFFLFYFFFVFFFLFVFFLLVFVFLCGIGTMANHYSYTPRNVAVIARARAVDVRTHFKNMREVCAAVKGMTLIRAKKYLNNVLAKKEIVPFRRFTGKVGRKAQCHQWKVCYTPRR